MFGTVFAVSSKEEHSLRTVVVGVCRQLENREVVSLIQKAQLLVEAAYEALEDQSENMLTLEDVPVLQLSPFPKSS